MIKLGRVAFPFQLSTEAAIQFFIFCLLILLFSVAAPSARRCIGSVVHLASYVLYYLAAILSWRHYLNGSYQLHLLLHIFVLCALFMLYNEGIGSSFENGCFSKYFIELVSVEPVLELSACHLLTRSAVGKGEAIQCCLLGYFSSGSWSELIENIVVDFEHCASRRITVVCLVQDFVNLLSENFKEERMQAFKSNEAWMLKIHFLKRSRDFRYESVVEYPIFLVLPDLFYQLVFVFLTSFVLDKFLDNPYHS